MEEKQPLNLSEKIKSIEPKKLILPVILLIIFIGTVVGIINYQQKVRQERVPKIEITKPQEGTILEDAQIVVEGTTIAGAKVKVNGKEVTTDSKGQFAAEMALKEGENTVNVAVENKDGKKATASRKIVRVAKQTRLTVSQPQTVTESTVEVKPSQVQTLPTTETELSNAGPESFWIPEIGTLSGALLAWYGSRKKFKEAIRKC